jgi:hypothetical protein
MSRREHQVTVAVLIWSWLIPPRTAMQGDETPPQLPEICATAIFDFATFTHKTRCEDTQSTWHHHLAAACIKEQRSRTFSAMVSQMLVGVAGSSTKHRPGIDQALH